VEETQKNQLRKNILRLKNKRMLLLKNVAFSYPKERDKSEGR
jgi:hypothetical protein